MEKGTTRTSRAGSWSKGPGFSLLELIVVMAILSVCVALVAPGLNPERFTDGMKTGIRRFTSALAQGRNQAMSSGKRQVILLDYSGQDLGDRVCFRLVSEEVDLEEKRGTREDENRNSRCFPAGVRIVRVVTQNNATGEQGARFSVLPNGLIQPGLIYMQEAERKRTLRIRPFQAYPEILRGHPGPGEERLGDFGSWDANEEYGEHP